MVVILLVFSLQPVLAQDDTNNLIIMAGEIGVIFDRASGELQGPLQPGTHIIDPDTSDVTIYSTRQLDATDPEAFIDTRTVDGHEIGMNIMVTYAIDPGQILMIHNRWGSEYASGFVEPTVNALVRSVIAEFTLEDIIGRERTAAQQWMMEQISEAFAAEGFLVSQVLIREVQFTEALSEAFESRAIAEIELEEARIAAEQAQMEAEFEAARARDEAQLAAELTLIHAETQGQVMEIIGPRLQQFPLLIYYEYIRALAADSSILIVPSDNPLILDLDELDLPALDGPDGDGE